MPTTVLSQNDSGVGVKNGVNMQGVKNFIGTFAPPFAVLNDSDLIKDLPPREKIAGMAETYYAQIAPHLYCGPVEGAANIQLCTCTPNFLIQESIQDWGGFHAEILKKPLKWQDGYIIPSTEPGLGIELDEEVAAKHPYEGDRLHLEMRQTPVLP